MKELIAFTIILVLMVVYLVLMSVVIDSEILIEKNTQNERQQMTANACKAFCKQHCGDGHCQIKGQCPMLFEFEQLLECGKNDRQGNKKSCE